MTSITRLGFLLVLWGLAGPALALDCPSEDGRQTALLEGEVAGQDSFSVPFGPDWTLMLTPVGDGWHLSVQDSAMFDLSWATPPLHGPNPKHLVGWHFRNADNTGPNTGEVNAPQGLRGFEFFTNGFDTGIEQGFPARDPEAGGTLEILDYGLADLLPGQTPRMVYLKFKVCLNWPAIALA
jgi:hypothetical protein